MRRTLFLKVVLAIGTGAFLYAAGQSIQEEPWRLFLGAFLFIASWFARIPLVNRYLRFMGQTDHLKQFPSRLERQKFYHEKTPALLYFSILAGISSWIAFTWLAGIGSLLALLMLFETDLFDELLGDPEPSGDPKSLPHD